MNILGFRGIVGPFSRRWITWWGAGLLGTYAVAVGVCLASGELEALYAWFLFLGIPSLLLASGVESILALVAHQFFSPGQPMRDCWLWLAAGAACRFVGYMIAHFLVPLLGLTQNSQVYAWALVLGSPLALLCTAFGLRRVVVLLRRHYWSREFSGRDWAVIGVLVLLLIRHLVEVAQDVTGHGVRSYATATLWMTEPLLLLVVMQSLAIRRSAVRMGSGLISRCWSALAAAALLTALGDVQMWAHRTFHLAEAVRAFTDPIWVAAGLAGALAPAFQIEASSLALTWRPKPPKSA